jgi:hypothetical protein
MQTAKTGGLKAQPKQAKKTNRKKKKEKKGGNGSREGRTRSLSLQGACLSQLGYWRAFDKE